MKGKEELIDTFKDFSPGDKILAIFGCIVPLITIGIYLISMIIKFL